MGWSGHPRDIPRLPVRGWPTRVWLLIRAPGRPEGDERAGPCSTSLGTIRWMCSATSSALLEGWCGSIGRCLRCWRIWCSTATGWCSGRNSSSTCGRSALSARRRWSLYCGGAAGGGGRGRTPTLHATVHGQGYRFVAPVEERCDAPPGRPHRPRRPQTCRRPARPLSPTVVRHLPRPPHPCPPRPRHRPAALPLPRPAPADRGTPAGHGAVWHAGAHHSAGGPAGLGGVPAPGADVPHSGPGVCAAV